MRRVETGAEKVTRDEQLRRVRRFEKLMRTGGEKKRKVRRIERK